MTKGGEFRRWYGNLEYVVNWENDGYEIRHFVVNGKLKSRPQNINCYFRQGLTWSSISSGLFSTRFMQSGLIPNAKGPTCTTDNPDTTVLLLAITNCSSFMRLLTFVAPTLDYSQGPLGIVPVPSLEMGVRKTVETIGNHCVAVSEIDWNSFEVSWDFERHPLI